MTNVAMLRRRGTQRVLRDVLAERGRQLERWGEQRHSPPVWLAILTEEVGEVAKEIADAWAGADILDAEAYRDELIQVAAVAVAAIESIDGATA